MTAYDDAVEKVRGGADSLDAARELLGLLRDDAQLRLLDGDLGALADRLNLGDHGSSDVAATARRCGSTRVTRS